MKKSYLVICLLVTVFLVSCFSPWKGEEATLNIRLGGGGSRSLVELNPDGTPVESLYYELILAGPGGTRRFSFTGTSAVFSVVPGYYHVTVRGISASNIPTFGGIKSKLRALGETEVEVKSGANSASVDLFSASEVTSWAELELAASGGPYSNTDPNYNRDEIILLKNGSGPWEAYSTIKIQRKITLRAEDNIEITRAGINTPGFFDENFFNVPMDFDYSIRELTLEGGKGTLTLNGGGGPAGSLSYSVITIGGYTHPSPNGKLVMNPGVKIINNLASDSAAVYCGGTFEMNGGEISGNTAFADGGAVTVMSVDGKFIMNGGTITKNSASTGGAVFINSGTFEMNNDSKIIGNSAIGSGGGSGFGGAVYFYYGTFTMAGNSVIGDNSADNDGGGIYMSGGNFTMNGGIIYGNSEPSLANRAPLGAVLSAYGGSCMWGNGELMYLNLPFNTDNTLKYP